MIFEVSSLTAREEISFILAPNSKAWLELWLTLTFLVVKGITMRGWESRLFMPNL